MAVFHSPETTVSYNEVSTMSDLTAFFSSQTSVSSNMMSTMSNVTRGSPVCQMTSLDRNVTGAGTPTGASIVSPIVMFLAGLIGNVLALVVLHRTRTEIRSMMFYTLVAALTWNDLVGICLTSPVPLASYINGRRMPVVDKLCRFHAFVMVCFGLSTPLIVCTMAIERSLALKCTYFYSKHCTPSSARVVVVVLWLFVLLFGALPLFGLGSYSLQYPCTWCFLDFRSARPLDMAYAYSYAVVNLAVVVVMIFCNALVMTTLCRVRKSRRRLSNASLNSTLLHVDAVEEKARVPQQQGRRRQHRDVELQMIWLVCAITTIFSVCWVPLMAYILFCLQSRENHAPVFGLVAVRLASLNQTLNPWIYVILRKSLLSRFRRVCCSCLREPDPPLPRRKPQQYLPVRRQPPAQVKGRPHNYVHVRHQLCPSSQFVGQHSDAASLSEGHRKQPKGSEGSSNNNSGSSSSRGRKSKCEKGRGGKGTWSSESCAGDEKRRVPGSASCSCSACRALPRGGEPDACCSNSRRSLTCSHPSCCRGGGEEPCGAQQVPGACTVSGEPLLYGAAPSSSSSASEPTPALLPTADGIYVDLFRQLSGSEVSDRRDATTSPDRSDVSNTTTSPCRSGSSRGGAAASVNVNSSTSEADDHGYVSRVSTESSRTSTPESQRSGLGKMGEDGAGVLSAQRDVGCSEAAGRRSATAAAAADEEEEKDEGAPVVASGCKEAIPEHRALRHVKHKGCRDDSEGFSSGVFLDSQDGSVGVCADCDGGDCGEGKVRGREGVGGGGGRSCSRTLSNSSAGTHTESSSGHDRSAAFSRQLSTSSAQRSDS